MRATAVESSTSNENAFHTIGSKSFTDPDEQKRSSPAQSALQAFSSRSRSSTFGGAGSLSASTSPASLAPLTRANTSRPTRRTSFDTDQPRPKTSPTSLPTSPSMSARDNDPSALPSQLDAKVCVLGSQGAGKTSLVHRYTTGQFSNTLNSTIGASFMTKRIVMPDCKVRLQIWDTAGQERFRSMTPIYYRGSHAAILVYDITNDKSFQDIRLWLQELRENMPSDLVVHVVGSKADLEDQREVQLENARLKLQEWIREDPEGSEADAHLGPTSPTPASNPGSPGLGSPSMKPVTRMGLVGQLSFGPGRKSQDELANSVPEREPWCRADISEVSAKSDFGIEEVFLNITQRLVDRKNNIEQDRILRSRNSVVLDQEATSESQPGWTCC